ncbi:MAG TPA: hypothetical protein VI997_02755, partial [Candidatus Thermoplasmatota archaeon]|nr:hypothetical protein [Candidatus Thermoplasmatota archaeon]
SHHNVLGYSGTQGNYVWVHDNLFEDNAIGLVSDSETDHPNYPQRGSVLERNVFADNDFDVYDGDCSDGWCSDVAPEAIEGVVFPVGTGVFFPGNNDNTLEDNVFVRNPRAAVWLASGQGVVIGPTSDPAAPPFVSSGNRFLGNSLVDNGVDFMWDGLGVGNCWEGNERSDDAEPTTDGAILPPCSVAGADLPATASAPNPGNAAAQAGLLIVEGPDGSRPACHYTGTTPCGGDHDVATWPTVARNRAAGYVPPPTPPSCGPSDDATCWS